MKNKRTLIALTLVAVIFIAAFSYGCSTTTSPSSTAPMTTGSETTAAGPTWVLKDNALLPENTNVSQIHKWFADELNKRSNGRVKIELYWVGALGGAMDNLKLISEGTIDLGSFFAPSFPKETPMASLLGLPMICQNPDTKMLIANELYTTYTPLKEEFENKNNVYFCLNVDPPLTCGASKTQIQTVADFKGKKMRTVGAVTDALKKLGGTPVAMQTPDIYDAAQRGVIDGIANVPFPDCSPVGFSFYEVLPYIFDYGLGSYSNTCLIMNLDRFNEFPDDIKKIIEDLRNEVVDYSLIVNAQVDEEALNAYKTKGTNLYVFSPEEKAKARSLIVPSLFDEYIANMEKDQPNVPVREFFDKALALAEKYDAQSKYVNPLTK
jgi:TRAP-type C4-dicarboxylate transport system substrate-binding protein